MTFSVVRARARSLSSSTQACPRSLPWRQTETINAVVWVSESALIAGRIKWIVKKKIPRGAEKARLKKERHRRMMRPNVPNWQIFFSRRQTSTRDLATQGNLQWLATFMHLANAFIQSDLHWRIFFLLIVCNVIDFSLLTYFKCYCGLIKISLMLREVRKRKRQGQRHWSSVRQQQPGRRSLTNIPSWQIFFQDKQAHGNWL